MELLVYARNVREGKLAGSPIRREVGAIAGERSMAIGFDGRVRSFVEVRLPMAAFDPCTEIQLLVAKAFAAWGRPGPGRVLRFRSERGSVAMMLEPGFERTRDLCRALAPVLPRARLLLERATRPRSRPRPRISERRSAVPQAIAPDADAVVPLRVFGTSAGSRLVIPRLDS